VRTLRRRRSNQPAESVLPREAEVVDAAALRVAYEGSGSSTRCIVSSTRAGGVYPVRCSAHRERLAIEGPRAGRVIAVPLHPARLRQRATTRRASRPRAAEADGPACPQRRTRTYASHAAPVGRDRLRRFENVKDAFSWRGAGLEANRSCWWTMWQPPGRTLDACASACVRPDRAP